MPVIDRLSVFPKEDIPLPPGRIQIYRMGAGSIEVVQGLGVDIIEKIEVLIEKYFRFRVVFFVTFLSFPGILVLNILKHIRQILWYLLPLTP